MIAVSKINKSLKAEIGVHLVASKLFSMNYIALVTSRNTKGYDVIVLNPRTNKGMGIQVKTIDNPKKEFPILSANFPNYEQKINEKIVCPFVFVDISDMQKPNFYIVPQDKLKRIVKEMIIRYEKRLEKEQPEKFKEKMNPRYKADLWAVKLDYIKQFENQWHIITDSLN